MTAPSTVAVTLRLPRDLLGRAQAVAAALSTEYRRCSHTDVMRFALRAYCDKHEHETKASAKAALEASRARAKKTTKRGAR